MLVAVSLDPRQVAGDAFEVPLWEFGLPDDGEIAAEELMRGMPARLARQASSAGASSPGAAVCIWRVRPWRGPA